MTERGKWQGMWNIVRFNRPFYVTALGVLIAALVGFVTAGTPLVRLACGLAVAGPAYFLIGSLGVSHLIYDCSDLYRWKWLDRALHGARRGRMILCHAGFDEVSQELRKLTCGTEWELLDHYEESRMTEPSVGQQRAAGIENIARELE